MAAEAEGLQSYYNLCSGQPAYLHAFTDAKPPAPTGVGPLDSMLSGGFRPGLYVVGGNTGAGKTAFALALMRRMASTGLGAVFYSLELSATECRARLGSLQSAVSAGLERFPWAEYEALGARARAELDAGTYLAERDRVYCADCALVAECPNVRIVDGTADDYLAELFMVEQEIAWAGSAGASVVFVDYLQCVKAGEGLDELAAMGEVARALNRAGMRAGVAVVALAAVSRGQGGKMRRGEAVGADIFRGSSWIEYTALAAFALARTEEQDGERYPEVTLQAVKNRRGALGEPITFTYDGAHGLFSYLGPPDSRGAREYLFV